MCKLIFGITGPSGAGKTLVSKAFTNGGVYVIDADMVYREVTLPDTLCIKELTSYFGKSILSPSGELDRNALGKIVFSDEKKLRILNEITHKYIKDRTLELINHSSCDLCAIDAAVLIGSNMEGLCKFIVCVLADRSLRLDRITKRDKIDKDAAIRRIDAQPDDNFYKQHSDFIIYNNSNEAELMAQAEKIINILRKEAYE